MSSNDPTLMFPNERFQIYFPDAEIPEKFPFAYRSCCLKIGSCIIIQKVIDEYKLRPMLTKRFGDDTGLILDLVLPIWLSKKRTSVSIIRILHLPIPCFQRR